MRKERGKKKIKTPKTTNQQKNPKPHEQNAAKSNNKTKLDTEFPQGLPDIISATK